jgi:hypothetical protein
MKKHDQRETLFVEEGDSTVIIVALRGLGKLTAKR